MSNVKQYTPVECMENDLKNLFRPENTFVNIKDRVLEIIAKNLCYEQDFLHSYTKHQNVEMERLKKENELLQAQVRMLTEYQLLKEKQEIERGRA